MLNNPFVLIGDIPPQYFCDRKQRRKYLSGIGSPYGQVPVSETLL